MATSGLQVLGFSLGVLSWVGMIGTCASPEWRKSSVGQTPIDNTLRYDGLWMRCNVLPSGLTQCDAYDAFFIGLPVVLQICRVLMITSLVLGFIAIIVTVLGLKCVTLGSKNQITKARVAMLGGIIFGIAAILAGAAVSYFAHGVVQEYFNPVATRQLPLNLRFEYGYALFIGWASLVSGLVCAITLCALGILIVSRERAAETQPPKHNYRPVSILQKVPQNDQIPLQNYNSGALVPSAPALRQVRIQGGGAGVKKAESLQPNGAHRSYQNSFASSSGRSGNDLERRRKLERSRQSSERSTRSFTRKSDGTTVDIHSFKQTERRRSDDDPPPRGLVRSVSGSLKQYL